MNIETMLGRPSVRGLEFRLGIEAFAHKVGSALNLPRVYVMWTPETTTAAINSGGELYLAGVKDEATVSRALVAKYASFVVHELLHHKYTDFTISAPEQYIRVLHNAIEDGWIENTGIQSGLLGNIGPLLGEMIDNMTREAIASVQDWNDPRQYPYVLAVHCRQHATLKCPTNPALAPIFDEAATRCAYASSSADTLEIAVWVYEQIKQASQQNNKGQKQNQPQGKPEDGSGKAAKGSTSPDQGEGEGEGADKGDQASNAPTGSVQSPDGVIPAEVEPALESNSMAGSFSVDTEMRHEQYHLGSVPRPDVVNAPVPARLRYEVKRLFDDSGLSDFARNRKAGSINVHALPSVATGNCRVFKRRQEIEGIDSAVVICLDVSGSMFQSKPERGIKPRIDPAVMTCRALLETLDAAGVKTAVVAFGICLSVPKGFNRNVKQANAMLATVSAGGGTNDYGALRYAHQMLAQRPENRKIAFVITDGRGNPDGVREQVKSGNALGLTTIGIGIDADVSDIYGQAVEVSDIADLGNASFKQIKLAA